VLIKGPSASNANMSLLLCGMVWSCACFFGCRRIPQRPVGEPSSAVLVDKTYINCRADNQNRSDYCVVYNADTGQPIISGTFVRDAFRAFVEQSDLHYVAYGSWAIFLQDGTRLVPTRSTVRNQLIEKQLKPLTGDSQTVDCTKVDAPLRCAIEQFKMHRSFYVIYPTQGIDSYGFGGFAADNNRNLVEVDFDSMGWWTTGLRPGAQMFDQRHTLVQPCPNPVILQNSRSGGLTCVREMDQPQRQRARGRPARSAARSTGATLDRCVARGLDSQRRYLFAIDGAKALRAGVESVFGQRAEVQRCQIHKRRGRASAEKRPGRLRPENPQRLRDDRLRGGEGRARENLPATGTHQPERGTQLGRRTGGNPDGAPVGRGLAAAQNAGLDESHRIVPLDRRESGAQRETLARRRTSLALDGHGVARGAEEIPASERLSGTGTFASPDELVVDSAGAGRVTCRKSRAATFN